MAICLNCGNIIHDEDMRAHKCDITQIPEKGTEKKPLTTDKAVSIEKV